MISRSTWLRRGCLFVACALLFAAPAAAQFDRAQLSGRVKDASGGRGARCDRHRHQPSDADRSTSR